MTVSQSTTISDVPVSFSAKYMSLPGTVPARMSERSPMIFPLFCTFHRYNSGVSLCRLSRPLPLAVIVASRCGVKALLPDMLWYSLEYILSSCPSTGLEAVFPRRNATMSEGAQVDAYACNTPGAPGLVHVQHEFYSDATCLIISTICQPGTSSLSQ